MMFNRQAHLPLFYACNNPVVNITAECRCRDFISPAKARALAPFGALLHIVAQTSLTLEHSRYHQLDDITGVIRGV